MGDYPLDTLREQLATTFPSFTVQTQPPLHDPSEAYVSSRSQYHSTRLLVLLEEYRQAIPVNRLLALTAFDLYVPGMNYVFGEARCPGHVAVVSTRRLKTSKTKTDLFGDRVLKEAVHEIGHTLGLRHCPHPLCVMHFSEQIRDTDRKNARFCSDCNAILKRQKIE